MAIEGAPWLGPHKRQTAPVAESRRRSRRTTTSRSTHPTRSFCVALLPLAAFLLLALLGPLLIPASPVDQHLSQRLLPPISLTGSNTAWDHALGTDGLGRDLAARIAVAARLSLLIGIAATAASAIIGVALGLVAGGLGGIGDRVVTTLADVQLAIPFVVVAIAVTATLGQSVGNVLIVLIVTGWVTFARVVRMQAGVVRTSTYVQAAVALGASPNRVLLRHVLPNVLAPIIVLTSQHIAAVMLYEASLTYLGVGLPADRVTLGGIIADGQDLLFVAWWVSALPGLAIVLAVFGFNLLGDVVQVGVRGAWRRKSSR
ncbi:MAG: ABC transporter permease [Chloroflexia bacterium]|nr:ABC transporter permease [Chloroflexia bacterium]